MSFAWKYLKGYRFKAILAPLLKLLEVVLELYVPLVVAGIIDRGISKGDEGYVTGNCLLLVLLAFLGVVVAVTAQYFAAASATHLSAALRAGLFTHIMNFSYERQDEWGKEKLLTRLTSDILKVQNGVNMTLRLFLRSPFVVVGAVVMAFTVDVRSALIFAVVVPVLSFIVVMLIKLTLPFFSVIQKKLDSVMSLVRSDVEGARVIRAFSLEDRSIEEFKESNSSLFKTQLKAGRISALQGPVSLVAINLATIFLIYTGALQVNIGMLTTGQVVALVNYMSQILVELVKFANAVIMLSQAIASGKRISEVLSVSQDTEGEVSYMDDGGDVLCSLKNVSMKYPGTSDYAIKDIDLKIKKGEFIGITGSTGCGKTTLINVIAGFYKADKGDAFAAKEFAIAPQRAELFSGTIRSNLLWANPAATDDELWDALEAACADEIVNGAKGSLSCEVERMGSNFSGGQRQRLAVARALVKKAPLVILDDSASALDYATEKRLRENMRTLPGNPAVIWVSQRISSIREADRIFVMERGRIVAGGTHDELLESSETYREIYESQV